MRFSRNLFFLILAGIFVLPFFAYKAIWLYHSVPGTGTMCFMGKTLNGQFSSTYPVIRFSINGKDDIFFNGNEGPEYKPGEPVAVRYQKNDPADARINQFSSIWVDTIIYALVPLLLLLVMFIHPDLIPWKSTIIIGRKPIFRIENDQAEKFFDPFVPEDNR